MENIKEKKKVAQEIHIDESDGTLYVLNDDYNTIMHVIECLMKYCGLNSNSAQECTYKIHEEGECAVLQDKKMTLYIICENLIDSGLNAEIR